MLRSVTKKCAVFEPSCSVPRWLLYLCLFERGQYNFMKHVISHGLKKPEIAKRPVFICSPLAMTLKAIKCIYKGKNIVRHLTSTNTTNTIHTTNCQREHRAHKTQTTQYKIHIQTFTIQLRHHDLSLNHNISQTIQYSGVGFDAFVLSCHYWL